MLRRARKCFHDKICLFRVFGGKWESNAGFNRPPLFCEKSFWIQIPPPIRREAPENFRVFYVLRVKILDTHWKKNYRYPPYFFEKVTKGGGVSVETPSDSDGNPSDHFTKKGFSWRKLIPPPRFRLRIWGFKNVFRALTTESSQCDIDRRVMTKFEKTQQTMAHFQVFFTLVQKSINLLKKTGKNA